MTLKIGSYLIKYFSNLFQDHLAHNIKIYMYTKYITACEDIYYVFS